MAVVYLEHKKQTATDFAWTYMHGLPSLVPLEVQMPRYNSHKVIREHLTVFYYTNNKLLALDKGLGKDRKEQKNITNN